MEYISYCGILCNECPVYVATATNDMQMKAKLAKEYSSARNQFSIDDMNCYGCFWEGNKTSTLCGKCDIRNCAEPKRLKNCGYCEEYPCSHINSHVREGTENRKRLDRIKASL
ncbi:MAG: DUF3795 domain-containing protein [Chloroflexi bacterium]|nr:DUF3795 domain-containing protein [Chloroflexota bacterium]